ncbi:bestrophin family ion channel [Vibrio sp. ABG19]|uniref:bestrophin family ion channel n=1 Tax=Vibrio sp. ABG19 TaxID=2817385 RepID=UPI00249EFF84|nr:bestrophin family ion channel [Vibrio sp. ABG19]WGY45304.1 hypothetical protein J0X00_00120 [Vibrio sp. ABG19]
MVVYFTPNLFDILFSLKGSIAKKIAKRTFMITALAAIIVLVESGYPSLFSQVSATPFTLLGISLSIVTTIVSYALFGLDAIGDELEDPFGHDENARPLDALVRIIERDILDTLNVTELPPQKKPVDYILS